MPEQLNNVARNGFGIAFAPFEPVPVNANNQVAQANRRLQDRVRQAQMLRPFGIAQDEEDVAELLEEMERAERRAMQEEEMRRINRLNRIDMSEVEEVMKVRHLNKGERDMYHNPKPDWHDSKKGDVCKNACVLEVEDIIRKHIK